MRDEVVDRGLGAGRRHDHGAHLLAHHLVGDAHRCRLADAGCGDERVLDLDRVDVLPAAVDHVLLAVDDVEQSVVVDARQIASVQPAFDERLGRGLGLVPVALHDVGAAHQQLTHPGFGIGLVDREVDDGHGEADRVGVLRRLLVGQERGQRRGLGQPEAVAHARAREGVLDLVHQGLGDGGAAVGDPAHRADVELGEARVAHDSVIDGGDRDQLVDTVLGDRRKEPVDVQRAGKDLDAAAQLERGDELAVAAGDVKQRDRDERRDARSLGALDRQAAKGVLAVGQKVGVRGHRALGKAGSAARVEDRREIARAEVVGHEPVPLGQLLAVGEGELRAGVLDDIGDLVLGKARVHRHRRGARELDAEEGQRPVDPVGQTDCHAV